MPDVSEVNPDGRTARRDRNRELVLDAALALFAEGHLHPGAPMVAERSGVSLRSVFRYFEDTEALLRAAIARRIEQTAPLFEIADLGQGTFDDRLDRYVSTRLRLYRAVAPTVRASLVRATSSEPVATALLLARDRDRCLLESMFVPELDAMATDIRQVALAVADTLVQFEAVDHLVVHLGLSDDEAAKALRRGLSALLVP